MEQVNERTEPLNWQSFLASTLIGITVGAFYHYAGAGLLIGMGLGFIAELVIAARKQQVKNY
jgi:F0F1-type ATP synthase assembly protein I